MLGLILAGGTGLMLFIYITLVYSPFIAFIKEEKERVKYVRKKLKWLSSLVLKSLNTRLKVIYKNKKSILELEREEGIIFVSNHQSNLDIPTIITALHMDIGFVAKKEMINWPFFSFWMKKSNCVFLNRENPREGIKDIKKAVELIKDGYPIVIFPEGERTLTGEILPFKKGSFKLATETNGIIVPVTIKGTYNIQKRGTLRMNRNQKVTVIIDEPIYVKKLSKDEVGVLNKTVQNIIENNYNSIE